MKKIVVITPIAQSDYLANTILDGLVELSKEGKVEFKTPGNYPTPFDVSNSVLAENDFIKYAQYSDLIIFTWGKRSTNYELAEKIGKWEKTVFVDGSEVGKDRRYDQKIQDEIVTRTYEGIGAIDGVMLKKCKKYFRREKPYINGIMPFPFGVETRYIHFSPSIKKDIDFVCIFGQEDFPRMRKEVRVLLEKFCKKNNFTCATKKTDGFSFDDTTKVAGRNEFYSLLARSKVGVSIGGGGFDTARFWEMLGNNCFLLTENIDIQMPVNHNLNFKRIYQFKDLKEFEIKLQELGQYIRTSYKQEETIDDYNKIIENHGSKARVQYILGTL
jgi:hypothetical protein